MVQPTATTAIVGDKIGMLIWSRGKVWLGALSLVGFGAIVGAGSVYLLVLRHKIQDLLSLQSMLRRQVQELHEDVEKLKSLHLAPVDTTDKAAVHTHPVRPTRASALKSHKKKNGARVTFQDGFVSAGEDEYITASSDSDYEESTVVRKSKSAENKPSSGSDVMAQGDARVLGLEELLKKIDELFDGSTTDQHEAYALLKSNSDKMQDSSEMWWRFAKATHMQAGVAAANGDKELQKSMLEQAHDYAKNALKLNEGSADAHKWFAVTLGARGEFVPTNEKIQNGFIFKEHIDKAIALNPSDGSLHHLLGRFCFEVSNLSWIERKVAATLFSSPPTSSYEEALGHFQTAERIWKPFVENRLYLAKAYIAMKDYSKAARWLVDASKLPVNTPNDRNANKLVLELLPSYQKYL